MTIQSIPDNPSPAETTALGAAVNRRGSDCSAEGILIIGVPDMGKDPAVLFYVDNFIEGTSHMTHAEVGAYIRLLCKQHSYGHMPLWMIERIVGRDFEEIWKVVSEKFKCDSDGNYYQHRMDMEKKKRAAYSASRSKNRSQSKLRKKHMSNTCTTYEKHMGNGNGNGNVNESGVDNENADESEIVLEHRECSKILAARILERRQQKITEKTLNTWDRDVRLMVERDERTVEDIKMLINECHDMNPTASGFTWRDNILSMGKLREKWNEGKIYIGMNAKQSTASRQYGRQNVTVEDVKRQMERIKLS